jgi:hypothetical protein
VFGIGATEYRSVAALQRLHDYSEWEPAVRAELEYAFKKKAMTLRTGAEFKAARALPRAARGPQPRYAMRDQA